MKPRMFIASSVGNLDLAYAAQEGLEHDVEPTVWNQGVFALSRSTMASLLDVVEESDFGLFVFAPSDITQIKDAQKQTVRDNVVFELGLFVGHLGQERCFILTPRGLDDLHLPTDLLGVTTASYDSTRQDGNLVAALGPACNRIRQSVKNLGALAMTSGARAAVVEPASTTLLLTDENDIISTIQSWLGSRAASDNLHVIHYAQVDGTLSLAPGSAKKYIEQAASRWSYIADRKGAETILFKERNGRY